METILKVIYSSIRWILVSIGMIISGWIWLDSRFDSKVEASEHRVMTRVEELRSADMEVIKSMDRKIDILIGRKK